MDVRKIMNGTYGEVWLDSDQVGECFGITAKVEIQKEEVKLPGQLATDTKMIGWKGTGTLKLYKVNSRMAKKMGSMLSDGKELRFDVISKLADPDAEGEERIKLSGVSLDDLTLAEWEAATFGQVEVPFTFTKYDVLDKI